MISKRAMRGLFDHTARATGVMRWFESRMRKGLTVLMYHRVLPDEEALRYPFRSLAMPERAFSAQVDWLSNNARVLPLKDALHELESGADRSKPLVSITFDDGYSDNATIAAPVLEASGVRGTFFVTSEFLRTGERLWFDKFALAFRLLPPAHLQSGLKELDLNFECAESSLAEWMSFAKDLPHRTLRRLLAWMEREIDFGCEINEQAPMSLDDLRSMHAAGHEIGAHTLTHPILPALDAQELTRELQDSKRQIEDWIDDAVDGFAYPNGDHSEAVCAAVEQAGHDYACTTTPGLNVGAFDRYRIARLDVTRDRVFNANGSFDPVAFRSEIARVRQLLRAG